MISGIPRPAGRSARGAVAMLLAGLVVGALAGCGGTGPGRRPAASAATTSASAVGPGQRLAERALLGAADLPLGFEAQESGSDTQAMGCRGIDALYLGSGVTGRAAASFTHTLSDVYVNETVTTRPGTASATLAAFRQASTDCRTFGTGAATYKVATVNGIGQYGDGTAALSIAGSMRESRPVVVVVVRIDDLVLVVAHADSGRIDPEVTRTLVGRAVAKAQRALTGS